MTLLRSLYLFIPHLWNRPVLMKYLLILELNTFHRFLVIILTQLFFHHSSFQVPTPQPPSSFLHLVPSGTLQMYILITRLSSWSGIHGSVLNRFNVIIILLFSCYVFFSYGLTCLVFPRILILVLYTLCHVHPSSQ